MGVSYRRSGQAWAVWTIRAAAFLCLPTTFADTFHLKDGRSVEGQVVERSEKELLVRTADGEIRIPLDSVDRIDESADAPDGDSDRPRAQSRPSRKKPPEDEATRREREEQRLVKNVQDQWYRRIHAIRINMLDSALDSQVQGGIRKINEITDPLAILPMAKVLSEGGVSARRALADALARFAQDEATLNLAVLALTDRDDEVRRRANSALLKRDDPRVVAQLRKALQSDNDFLIRNAAVSLGLLKAAPAVPELVEALRAQRRKAIDVPVREYFGRLTDTFNTPISTSIGPQVNVRHLPQIGIAAAGGFVVVRNERQVQDVTVFRTEVLEALVQITGKNHGFDEAAWRRWYQEQKP